jgi:hypothetical protein
MLESQCHRCGVCGQIHSNDTGQVLCVDHDHNAGEVRGLLCTRCNVILGMISDDINILQRAIAYLEKCRA